MQESEKKFQLLFERSADAIFLLDPSQGPRFVDCNDAAVRMLGYRDKHEILNLEAGRLSADIQPDGTQSIHKAVEMIKLTIKQGSHRFEWHARRANADLFFTEVVMTSIQMGEQPLIVTVARDITERKNAELALRQNQQLLTSITENISEGIYRSCPERGLIFANRAYLRMFGYSSLEELRSVEREDLYADPMDRVKLVGLLEAQGFFANEEVEFKRKDGSTFWGLAGSIAVYSPGTQNIDYHVGVITEITAKKRIEAELRATEQRWRLLFEQSPLSVQIFSPDGWTRRVNTAWMQLFNISENDAKKVNILQDPQLTAAGVMGEIRRAFAGEVVQIRPVPFTVQSSPDGGGNETRWIGGLLFPLLGEGGETLEVVCIHEDITARKKAEDQIRELNASLEQRIAERTTELSGSEARLRTLVEHAPEAIVVFDVDAGRFVTVNTNAEKLFGYSREELLTMGPADVSPAFQPDGTQSPDLARERIVAAVAGETPVFEWTHRHKSGRSIPCEIRLVRLPAEGRNLVRGSVADTTDRKRRENIQRAIYQLSESIHKTEDLNSLYAEIHRIVKQLMPADNFYLSLHEPETDLYHYVYHVDQVDSRPLPRKMSAGLNGYVLRHRKALLANRESMTNVQNEWYLEHGTPSAIWLGVPLAIRGTTLGIMAVQDYQDEEAYGEDEKQVLTYFAEQIALAIDRKRAEQALRESEEKHRALFEASSQGVMLHDEHQFLEVNPAAVRIMGYASADQILGKHPAQTAAPIQGNGQPVEPLARQYLDQCVRDGSARFEWLARSPSGNDIPLEVILTRIQMRGRPIIQAVINDITERKQAEAELLRNLAHEKELSQLKSNFVSMVSHEFRTPLGIIMSSADILESYFERLEPEERKEHLHSIHKNTRRMANLMEEVLLLSKAEAGKLQFEPAPMDLVAFSRRIIDEVQSSTHRRCPVEFQSVNLPKEITADEKLLGHVLTNLLSNAVKYSPPGEPVSLHWEGKDQSAICTIRDRGIGIPPEDRERLFHAFYRGRNVGQVSGTGLGLMIVKRCLELHGGEIEVQSAVGQGTTIIVTLPLT